MKEEKFIVSFTWRSYVLYVVDTGYTRHVEEAKKMNKVEVDELIRPLRHNWTRSIIKL